MADIRDWGAFVRGRWDWTKHGYEKGFPRGCQFTDLYGAVEFDGRRLVVEPKHHDGIGPCEYPDTGQLLFLRDEVRLGKTVIVLYGCGPCNSPQAVRVLGRDRTEDRWEDWRGRDLTDRRQLLKLEFDRALALVPVAEQLPERDSSAGLVEVAWPEVRRPPDWTGAA
jgi:hypothetical protein